MSDFRAKMHQIQRGREGKVGKGKGGEGRGEEGEDKSGGRGWTTPPDLSWLRAC